VKNHNFLIYQGQGFLAYRVIVYGSLFICTRLRDLSYTPSPQTKNIKQKYRLEIDKDT
jgi:hypothetical protein